MRDVFDAEYRVVDRPYRVPWATIFWFCVYAGGAAWAVADEPEPIARGAIAFAAACFWPAWTLFRSIAQKVPEEDAQRLRTRLSTRPATIWEERASRPLRGRGLARSDEP